MPIEFSNRPVPLRALIFSIAALIVPVLGALEAPEGFGEYGALLWLLALVPAFLLAYYRGWKGVAIALATGMVTLSATQVVATWIHRTLPDTLLGVVIAYITIAMAVGWLAEALHKERAVVEDMAFTDLLTRLPNRRHARLFLDNEFAAAKRGRLLSVVLFDLDHFKAFNDQWGHGGGDEALRVFANILAPLTRRMDLSARFGGEEFLSVLTSTDTEGALIFADRIRSGLAETVIGTGGRLTVSAGLASFHASMRSPDELLAAADHALYQAKRDGRNRVRLFTPSATEQALPSPDAVEAMHEMRDVPEPPSYPRSGDDIGRTPPPVALLPHQITGFGEDRRVLVVEDDAQVRSLLRTYLGREGFQVTEAVDVPSGIEALEEEFDVVVSDIRLPGASGLDVVAAVKARRPTTPVVVITGLQDAQVAAEALNAGADRYLFKPFGMPELRRHLADLLEERDRLARPGTVSSPLSEAAQRREGKAQQAIVRALRSLVEAVEARSSFQRGHGERVAAYAERIADALDPEGEQIPRQALRLACEVHDVGKIGVPREVLDNAGALGPEETGQVRKHPTLGRHILDPFLNDEHVRAVVAWHHERWDGSGYPDGLSGTAIPPEARLVALCNVLDGLTSDVARGSRSTWDDAIARIRAGAGTEFDPEVVAAMDACLDDLRALFESRGGAAKSEAT